MDFELRLRKQGSTGFSVNGLRVSSILNAKVVLFNKTEHGGIGGTIDTAVVAHTNSAVLQHLGRGGLR